MWQRQPGQGRYAHLEHERRLLLGSRPLDLSDPVEIVDRYLEGTRLRLRRVTGNGPAVHKLAQKIREDLGDPSSVMLTNIYLDGEEYSRLRPARRGAPKDAVRSETWHGPVGH